MLLAKPDNYSRLMRLAQLSKQEFVRPRTEGFFYILKDAEDMATLIKLRDNGHRSKEARNRLNKFVEDKTKEASTRLKKWLGLRRGAPRNLSKRGVWVLAAALKKRYSWPRVTRTLDPKGYADDPHLATERMRQGVRSVQREKAQPRGKSA